jgi:hypothetical protein
MNLGALVSLIVVTRYLVTATVTRYLVDEKKRKLDDTALYRHMLDHISSDSIRLIELDPAYLGFLQRLEGDKAIPYMAIVRSSHSSGQTSLMLLMDQY